MTRAPDGVEIIGLSEHVDYWDGLGWRDPFSSRQFTERQNRYAQRFGPDRVYTPQMIVDGAVEFVGSDRAQLLAAIAREKAQPKAGVALAWHGASLAITISGATAGSDVMLAVTEDGLSSDVRRGENAGHTLPHVRVVRALTKLGSVAATGVFATTTNVATRPEWSPAKLRVAVFVQARGLGVVTGAASAAFPAANLLPR